MAAARTPVTTRQIRKLAELAGKHGDLTYAVTSDGNILVRFLTAWLRDGYKAVIGGDVVFVEPKDVEPICYLIPSHGRLVGYCKEKPVTERDSALVGTLAMPLPKAASRLSFKAFDKDVATKLLVQATKREAA